MKAMVLAAGQGTRLRPITDAKPKALVPVAGRPMIEYPLLLLRHYGIREIMINLHHLGEQVKKHLGDGKQTRPGDQLFRRAGVVRHRWRFTQGQIVSAWRNFYCHQHRRFDRFESRRGHRFSQSQ